MKHLILSVIIAFSTQVYAENEVVNEVPKPDGIDIRQDNQIIVEPHIDINNRIVNKDRVREVPRKSRGSKKVSAERIIRPERIYPVSSAASVFPGICNNGLSGQDKDFGFSISTENAMCKYYEGAKQSLRAYERAVSQCLPVSCTVECKNKDVWTEAHISPCQAKANTYLTRYHWNMDKAQEIIESESFGDSVDSWLWWVVKWIFAGKVL